MAVRPLWSPPRLAAGERIEAYTGINTARIDLPGSSSDALMVSAAPLLAENEAGVLRPINTQLRPVAGVGWEPENTRVPVKFAERLDNGVTLGLGTGDVRVRVRGAAKVPGVLRGGKLFYVGGAVDTDVITEALPEGASISWAVRSPRASDVVTLDLELPPEVRLVADDAKVLLMRGAVVVGEIAPPRAVDAQGTAVPVAYEVDGTAVTVRTRHTGRDVAYPISVDPVITDVTWYVADPYPAAWGGPTGAGWGFDTQQPGSFTRSATGAPLGITALGCDTCGGSAWWAYTAPANSRIFRAEFHGAWHWGLGRGGSVSAGLFNGSSPAPQVGNGAHKIFENDQWSTM